MILMLLAACQVPTVDSQDCDSASCPPAAEVCDGRDNDGDGLIDEDLDTTVVYRDMDHDGRAGEVSTVTCLDRQDWAAAHLYAEPDPQECDDTNPALPRSYWVDADEDGYIDGMERWTCDPGVVSATWSATADCDDGDPRRTPGADETCGDGVLNDCLASDRRAARECRRIGQNEAELPYAATLATTKSLAVLDVDGDGIDDAFGVGLQSGKNNWDPASLETWMIWGESDVHVEALQETDDEFLRKGDAWTLASSTVSGGQSVLTVAATADSDAETATLLVGLHAQWILDPPGAGAYEVLSVGDLGDPTWDASGPVASGRDTLLITQADTAWLLYESTLLGSPHTICVAPDSDDCADADGLPTVPVDTTDAVAVLAAGDMNRDGLGDVVAALAPTDGAPSATIWTTDAKPLDTQEQVTWTSATPSWTGASAASDLNGDGLMDAVFGSSGPIGWCGREEDGETVGAAVVVLWGSDSGQTRSTWFGSDVPSFGKALAGGQDLDGDGFQDLAIAANSQDDSSIWVLFGDRLLDPGTDGDVVCDAAALAVQGTASSSLGTTLAVGQLSGDGSAHVVATSSEPITAEQRVHLFSLQGY
jgi:hypothetical protein